MKLYKQPNGRTWSMPVAEACGVSPQTAWNVLRRAGVATGQRAGERRWRKNLDEIVRLYVEERRSMREITEIFDLTDEYISEALRFAGVEVFRGGGRAIAFPELRGLAIGESLDLPNVGGTNRYKYTRFYYMAKKAGIRVSVRVISDDKVRVTRKA